MTVYDPKDDLYRLAVLKKTLEDIEKEKNEVETRLLDALKASGHKTLTSEVDGVKYKGTVCAPTRVVIDETRLRAALDTTQWKKITTLRLDKEKLEAAVVQNIVDRNVVAAASDVTDSKPYIRITGKVPDAGQHVMPVASKKVAQRRAAATARARKVRPAKKTA